MQLQVLTGNLNLFYNNIGILSMVNTIITAMPESDHQIFLLDLINENNNNNSNSNSTN